VNRSVTVLWVLILMPTFGARGTADENMGSASLAALFGAARKRNLKDATALLGNGADVNRVDKHGRTALMVAISIEIARLLTEHGAEIEVRDNNGWTPLMHAAINNDADLIKFFAERGADLNAKDRSR